MWSTYSTRLGCAAGAIARDGRAGAETGTARSARRRDGDDDYDDCSDDGGDDHDDDHDDAGDDEERSIPSTYLEPTLNRNNNAVLD